MPKIEFEGIKVNLNSLLLMAQLAGVCIYVGIQWNVKDGVAAANAAAIVRLQQEGSDIRKELEAQRSQAIATAVLKADMDNLKLSLARIERTLEVRLK